MIGEDATQNQVFIIRTSDMHNISSESSTEILTSNFPKKSPSIFLHTIAFSLSDNGELVISIGTAYFKLLLDDVVAFFLADNLIFFRMEVVSSISGSYCTGLCVSRRDDRDGGDGVTIVDEDLFGRFSWPEGVDGCRRLLVFIACLASARPRLARRSSFRLIRSRRNCS
jgi:hypothetical protein